MTALVGSPDGRTLIRADVSGADVDEVGRRAASALLANGAGGLLK